MLNPLQPLRSYISRIGKEASNLNARDKADLLLAGAGMIGLTTNTAAAFLGPVPLPGVVKIGVTVSNKAVKFRAKGQNFFAYQKGEYEDLAVDITLNLVGPYKWLMYNTLLGLYLWQRARPEIGAREQTTTNTRYSIRQGDQLVRVDGGANGEFIIAGGATQLMTNARRTVQDLTPLQTERLNRNNNVSITRNNQVTNIQKEQETTLIRKGESDVIVHKTYPFVSKEHVILRAYIESIVLQREASTSNKLVVDLFIREFKRPGEYKEIVLEGVDKEGYKNFIRAKVNVLTTYSLYLLLNQASSYVTTGFEMNRHATMRRIDFVDLFDRRLTGGVGSYPFWGSEPLYPEPANRDPRVSIYDPEGNDEDAAIDVSKWYYFDVSNVNLPVDVAINMGDFGGDHIYSIALYVTDDIPRNQFGFYNRSTYLTCVVKDEDENITNRFVVDSGIIYRIGYNDEVKICFDQLDLRYNLSLNKKFGHTITGRWIENL